MIFFRQILQLSLAHMRMWVRSPRQLFISIILGSAFLIIGNQVFVVRLGPQIAVGIYTPGTPEKRIQYSFRKIGVTSVAYDSIEAGRSALADGRITALVTYSAEEPPVLHLVLAGRNPIVDREIAALMLRVAGDLSDRYSDTVRVTMENVRYTPGHMTTFMTASLLPFLILCLAYINCGMYWLREWERGTAYTFLATPAYRSAMIISRALAGGILSLIVLACSLVICRLVVPWQLPVALLPWCIQIGIQMWAACGMFFLIAVICRSSLMLFVDVASLAIFIFMFVSGTISPLETMPAWERVIAFMTPMTYAVRAMRAVMLGLEPLLLKDCLIVVTWGAFSYALGGVLTSAAVMKR
jgi:ABC-type multidrug transport system permease subunit